MSDHRPPRAGLLDSLLPRVPIRYFRLFWGYAGARILVVFALTMVMSYSEAIGIALFFPLFTYGHAPPTDPMSQLFGRLMGALHLSPSPSSALPIIVAIFVGKAVLQYVSTMYQVRLTHYTVTVLRKRVLSALGRADYRFLTTKSSGHAANLVVNEVTRAASGFQHYLRSVPPLVNAAVLFGIVLFIDWRLTLVCVAMGFTMFAFLRLSGRAAGQYSQVVSKESSKLTSLLIQAFQAFKYLRATAGFGLFEQRLLGSSERALQADMKASSAGAVMLSVSQPIMVVFLSGLLYYRAAVRGEELASLFIMLVYFLRIMTELFSLQTAWQTFCSYMGSVDTLRDAVDETEANAEQGGTRVLTEIRSEIRCEHLTFAYVPGRPVLKGVSLRIPRHTTVAFVGRSGSGKSTLVDLITGTLKPSSGAVTIDDVSLADVDLGLLRARLGYVPQDAMVFEDTVANNIALWRPDVTREQLETAARRAHCAEFIEDMPARYEAQIGDRGVMLSGGQRQRLAIARELLKEPALLVLDEATSALDSASERAIQSSIDELRGKMTILIIAHRLSTVRSCDRIYLLEDGHVAEEGTYDELVAKPGGLFREMVALQSLGDREQARQGPA